MIVLRFLTEERIKSLCELITELRRWQGKGDWQEYSLYDPRSKFCCDSALKRKSKLNKRHVAVNQLDKSARGELEEL